MTVALGADFGVVDVPLNAIVYPRSSRGGLREGVLGGECIVNISSTNNQMSNGPG